jgi:hypothetical protein
MVTYKNDLVAPIRFEINLSLDDSGKVQPNGCNLSFQTVRCLGGSDGKVHAGHSGLQGSEISEEVLAELQVVINKAFEELVHLGRVADLPALKSAPLLVDGKELVFE